ncbi:hypothetical protein [Lentzea kentuckyensis]|uniref:hypothetical protein n=1 Tax=Lentzea kentuckyensis TaxID=360086 RepID=UPI000A3716EA|nr:hypothetical protein [Lentzea kentuckyensis]
MNDTEQLVKDALGKLAERTPHPGPTLNALRRKRKQQRNNIFLIATAGMAAVAVLIFAGLVASDRYTPPNHNDAAAALVPDRPAGQPIALKYTPHWLPDGFVETHRAMSGDQVSRDWVPAGSKGNPLEQAEQPRVTVQTIKDLPADHDKFEKVSVRELQAWVLVHGSVAELFWKAQDVINVTVRGTADPRAVALRVADSVRMDAKATFLPPFWLDGKPATEVWGDSAYSWSARWAGEKYGVTVSTSAPAKTDGALLTLRGQKGSLIDDSTVAVRDSSGFWITVNGARGERDALVAIAGRVQLQIVPQPDTVWIGKGV